jgi:hypothetical protein
MTVEFGIDEGRLNNLQKRKLSVARRLKEVSDDIFVSLPVVIAFCGLAAALRPWNRLQSCFILIICLPEDASYTVYQDAAKLLLRDLGGDTFDATSMVRKWGRRYSVLDQEEALKMDRALFLCEPDSALDDNAHLFADAVLRVAPRTKRQIEFALSHFGLPFDEE